MKDALLLLAEERERQQSGEGWSEAHDDAHTDGSLADAAATYALTDGERRLLEQEDGIPCCWPESWGPKWWKPTPDDRIKELVKAGALIVAEIERLQRANPEGS